MPILVREVEEHCTLHRNILGGGGEREDVVVDHMDHASSGDAHPLLHASDMLADEPHEEEGRVQT